MNTNGLPITYIITTHCGDCGYSNTEMYHNYEPTKHRLIRYIHRFQCNKCWGIYLNRNNSKTVTGTEYVTVYPVTRYLNQVESAVELNTIEEFAEQVFILTLEK